ncbi:MAG: hypothetical protein ISQ08_05720 [Planctomycetes bacterium]|nr:hypothetical protein [Planctomycetota bacterium]
MSPQPSDLLTDADLGSALHQALPDLALLERDLEFDGARFDLACADRTGRAWLVVQAARGDAAVLEAAVDAHALGARLVAWLEERHPGRIDRQVSPSLAAVGWPPSGVLTRRLEAVQADCWWVGLRTVRAGGREQRMASLEPVGARARSQGLGGLADLERLRLDALTQRLRRIDERLELSDGPHGRAWSLGGRTLVTAWVRDGVPLAAVGDERPVALDHDGALEALLDRCVEEYLQQAPEEGDLPQHELRPQPRRGGVPMIP